MYFNLNMRTLHFTDSPPLNKHIYTYIFKTRLWTCKPYAHIPHEVVSWKITVKVYPDCTHGSSCSVSAFCFT